MHCRPRHMLNGGALQSRGSRSGSEAARTATEQREDYVRGNAFRDLASNGKNGFAAMYARRKGEHGAAILESFLCMVLIGMILFGILQIFQLVVADMVTDYAAFRGARSAAVGFRDELALREALVKAAPVSGPLVIPNYGSYSGYGWNQLETEKSLLRGFMQGERLVEYADWVGKDRYHMSYQCPHYGQPLIGGCSICGSGGQHHVRAGAQGFDQSMRFRFEFVNYPLSIPLHDWLTGRESITISGESELTNHSSAFLEE